MGANRNSSPYRWGGERRILLLVCAAIFFNVLNGTMVNIALPAIGRELVVEQARLGWVITGYLLVFGVAVPFYGRLADVFGARRLFMIGLGVFTVASVACALSVNYPMLLGGRILQAIGAAAIPGLGMAIISGVYPPERRGSALGYVSATIGAGAAIGPSTGGFIADLLNWHYMFVLSALAGLLLPLCLRLLPAGERRPGEGIDLLGGSLVALSVGGALLAATEGARGDLASPIVLGAVATSLLAAVALVFRQRTARSPFIPRDLLRNRRFLALVAVSFTAMTANMGTFISLPLLLTGEYNLSGAQVGLVLLPNALALALLGPIAGRVVDRIGGRLPVRAGLLTILAVVLAYSTFGVSASPLTISLLAAVQGVGFAFLNAPLTTMVSLAAGKERQGSGLSINSMAFFLGGGFGTAFLTAVLTLRSGAQSALNPAFGGRAVAYSDSFLLFAVPLLIALGMSLLSPVPGPDVDAREPVGTPRTAGAPANR